MTEVVTWLLFFFVCATQMKQLSNCCTHSNSFISVSSLSCWVCTGFFVFWGFEVCLFSFFLEGGLLSGCISVSVVIDFLCKQPQMRGLEYMGRERVRLQFATSSPTSRHFVSRENGSSQITGWCLQQSPSLSSPCFHDNDMTCLAPRKQGGETNPSFLTAPKCLLSHPQQFSHRQTQHSDAPATTKHCYLPSHSVSPTAGCIFTANTGADSVLHEEHEILH